MERSTFESSIADNLERLRARIAEAVQHAGRRAQDVQLIAVSKNQSAQAVAAAVAAGQRTFGENTVQDALTKIPGFAGQGLEWHFIGHLQSNKAKLIPNNFAWVHSLDSAQLALRLARLAREQNTIINALIEVNITRDPAKHGVTMENVAPLLDALLKKDHSGLQLRGLMTIGPHPAPESGARASFAQLRELRDKSQKCFELKDFTELSMGMSGDYAAAIQEGSTMVRIGTAIFGQRE